VQTVEDNHVYMRLVFDNPSCHRIPDLSDLPRCLVKFRENPVKPDPFLQLLHFVKTSFTNSTCQA